jgi:hypothetical protein
MRRTLETPQTLVLEEEERLTGLMNLLPSENTQKTKFWRRALPYTSSGSAGAPPYTVWEHYKAPLALLRECWCLQEYWHPPKAY